VLRAAVVVAMMLPCMPPASAPVEAASSSDSNRIVFHAAMDGKLQIFTINPDGSGRTSISTDPTRSDEEPSWSPDGKIAFASDFRIFAMNADGSGRTQITAPPRAFDTEPCWSPDGTKIAFVSRSIDGVGDGLWVVNANGSDRSQLLSGRGYRSPDWSPDGTKILFNGPDGMQVMNADGSDVTTLRPLGFHAKWSPDGTKIVFTEAGDIWVMDANGENPTRLVDDSTSTDQFPTWSPDGTRIAFSRSFPADGSFSKIWTMNADGSNQVQISFGVLEQDAAWYWPPAPSIACPANVEVLAADGECSAVIELAVRALGLPLPSVTCTPESGSAFPLGTTTVSCTASNGAGPDAVCAFFVTVVEDDAPTISDVSASPSVIWPPDRRMVDVEVSYTAEDCSGEVACSLSVASNEPIDGPGSPSPDWEVVDAHHVRLRAEQARNATGRIYTITITCRDPDGNSLTHDLAVPVLRNR
jgi:Tol biopolymer transport system component